MEKKIFHQFMNSGKIDGLTLGVTKLSVIDILGEPNEISKIRKFMEIYSYYNNLLQITINKDIVYLIAFEFNNFKNLLPIVNNNIEALLNYLFMNRDETNFMQLLDTEKIFYKKKGEVIYDGSRRLIVGKNIILIFQDNEIDSLQVSNSSLL